MGSAGQGLILYFNYSHAGGVFLLYFAVCYCFQTVWIQIRPDIFMQLDLGTNCLQMLSADDKSSQ